MAADTIDPGEPPRAAALRRHSGISAASSSIAVHSEVLVSTCC
ncbi:hypothetical protein [Streptomyces sp. PT12]|nr:hypothetical protein [Streptomyces sp. PT12]